MRLWMSGVVLVALGASACGKDASNGQSAEAAGAPSQGGSSTSGEGGAPAAGSGGASSSGGSAGSGASGANTAGGAKSDGGTAGTDTPATGGAGTAGAATGATDDPDPVEPNLSGLVPTSSQWVLYENPPTNGASFSSDIELLDIASNQVHPANPGNPYDVIARLSPDGRSYFFSDLVGNRIIRLEPTGYVPAHALEGFVTVGGGLRVVSWSFDSRFALLQSTNNTAEIADMRLGTRVATGNVTAGAGAFAPAGYAYYYGSTNTPMSAPRYARVTQSGSTEPAQLPPDARSMAFDTSGRRLFYALGNDQDGYKLFSLSVANGQVAEITFVQAGEWFDGRTIISTPNDSVIVTVRVTGTTQRLLRRVFLDGTPAASVFSNPGASQQITFQSADANLMFVQYADDSLELIRAEPYARRAIAGSFPVQSDGSRYGIVGNHAYYVASDSTVHVADIDGAGQLRDANVSPFGQTTVPCTNYYDYTPQQKLAVLVGGGSEVEFFDLTQTPPVLIGTFTPSADGYKVTCPSWGDLDTALFLTESNGTLEKQYVTRWKGAGIEAPQPLPQPVGKVLAVMYR